MQCRSQPVRVDWVDAAKGFAIVCVVLGHALRGLEPTGHLDPRTFAALDARIYAFYMPLFFMLSGFFHFEESPKSSVARLRRSTFGLLVPLVVWTYAFLMIRGVAGGLTNQGGGLHDVMRLPVPGLLHFWFLWALWLMHVATILAVAPLRGARLSTGALAALAVAAAALASVPLPATVARWIGPAVAYLPFFLAGGLVWRLLVALAPGPPIRLACAVGFAVVCASAAGPDWRPMPDAVLALLLAALAVVALSGGLGGAVGRAMGWMGALSLSIYVMHTIFSAGLRIALVEAGIRDAATIVVLTTAVGLVGPILVTLALRGRTEWSWLGLHRQHLPRRR